MNGKIILIALVLLFMTACDLIKPDTEWFVVVRPKTEGCVTYRCLDVPIVSQNGVKFTRAMTKRIVYIVNEPFEVFECEKIHR